MPKYWKDITNSIERIKSKILKKSKINTSYAFRKLCILGLYIPIKKWIANITMEEANTIIK